MHEIKVPLSERSYAIMVGTDILSCIAGHVAKDNRFSSCLVVTHPKLLPLYAAPIVEDIGRLGLKVSVLSISPGERNKSLNTVQKLYAEMVDRGLDRKSLLVSVGGGVLGDMVGFAAATYMRGISFIQVPTTLLAQVDASIGGKTGVDYRHGKNLIGAFHQPIAVYTDIKTLSTLSRREFKSGLAEVIKYGIIRDKGFFAILSNSMPAIYRLEKEQLLNAVTTCCRIKAEVVAADETESGLRAILNFGHTLGHALESVTNYRRFTHGEAISIGMVLAGRIGESIGFTPASVVEDTVSLLKLAGLPTELPPDISHRELIETTSMDKKSTLGKPAYVLASSIGHVELIKDVDPKAVEWALKRTTSVQ